MELYILFMNTDAVDVPCSHYSLVGLGLIHAHINDDIIVILPCRWI